VHDHMGSLNLTLEDVATFMSLLHDLRDEVAIPYVTKNFMKLGLIYAKHSAAIQRPREA
jgi:hypothetical protein